MTNEAAATTVVSARFTDAELDELEQVRKRMEKANEGVKFTLADVIRSGALKLARMKLAKAVAR
jgi:DNA-binding GntR family transcriptional regulator